jgi:CheY-like chemotaxis protein
MERMRELDEAKSRLFANLSHEFRTPLTVILGPVDAWFERRDTEALTAQLEPIRRNARRLLGLITQLLDVSRLEAGSLDLKPEPIDLADQMRELVGAFRPLAERRGVTLTADLGADALPGLFDPDAVEKVVSNLLSNALKFTERGGKVHLDLSCVGSDAVLEVSDTGIGIPADRLESIFERFQRVDDSGATPTEGTGIGLSIVREMVQLMNGEVTVESREGFGSRFTVRIPYDSVAPDTIVGRPETMQVPELLPEIGLEDETETGRGPLILVADDHPDIRAYVARHLSVDHRVAQASDGASALAMARKDPPDLVIADVMMPGLDGFALCRAMREDESLAAIPVILLTARAEEEDRIRGLQAGADDYLTKPFSVRELEVRVTSLMLSRRSLREAFSRTIRVLPEEIDVKSRDVSFVEQVLGLMNHRLGDSAFGTDMLADEIGLSRRQVERRVKEALGRTPPDLLREMRLERAAQILRARPGTIGEVAQAVGFRSASHFAAAFRKAFGVSPSEFAEESPSS